MLLAEAGVSLAVCIVVIAVAPVVGVVAEETGGRARRAELVDEAVG